jgi:hypothetical protein
MDSEPLKIKDDMIPMIADSVLSIQFKLFAIVLIVFFVVNTDTFIRRVLSSVDGAVELNTPTTYGTAIQGMALFASMVVVDGVIKRGII